MRLKGRAGILDASPVYVSDHKQTGVRNVYEQGMFFFSLLEGEIDSSLPGLLYKVNIIEWGEVDRKWRP